MHNHDKNNETSPISFYKRVILADRSVHIIIGADMEYGDADTAISLKWRMCVCVYVAEPKLKSLYHSDDIVRTAVSIYHLQRVHSPSIVCIISDSTTNQPARTDIDCTAYWRLVAEITSIRHVPAFLLME